jgi:hypothetical protein
VNVYPDAVGDGQYSDRLLVYSNDASNSPVAGAVFVNYTKGSNVLQMAIDHIVGRTTLTGTDFTEADKNNSGKIEVGDVILIIKP